MLLASQPNVVPDVAQELPTGTGTVAITLSLTTIVELTSVLLAVSNEPIRRKVIALAKLSAIMRTLPSTLELEKGTGSTLVVVACFATNANQEDHANPAGSMEISEVVPFAKVWLRQTICEII